MEMCWLIRRRRLSNRVALQDDTIIRKGSILSEFIHDIKRNAKLFQADYNETLSVTDVISA